MRKLLSYTAALALGLFATVAVAQSQQPSTSVYNRNPALLDQRVFANFSAAQTNGCAGSGAPGTAGALILPTQGIGAVSIFVSPNPSAAAFALQVQGSSDNFNNAPTFQSINSYPVVGGDPLQKITAGGSYQIDSAGFRQICIYASALASGSSVNVWMEGSAAAAAVGEVQGVPLGFPINVNLNRVGGANPVFGFGPSAPGVQRVAVAQDQDLRPYYRCAATFTPITASAVTLITMQGSANKTVHITKWVLSSHATANTEFWGGLQRTSALGSGGTVVAPTVATLDSRGLGGASSAVCQHYTSTAKAAGTAVGGPLTAQEFTSNTITTTTIYNPLVCVYPEGCMANTGNLVLRGTGDFIEFQNTNAGNLGAATIISYAIEWFEDNF